MGDAPRQIHDLLLLVSYVRRNEGAPVEEVAAHLGVDRRELLRYVDTLLMCGKPPFLPDDFILISVENDRIYVDIDQALGHPVRLTAQEALAISVALRALEDSGSELYGQAARSALGKIKAHLSEDVAELLSQVEHRIAVEGTARGAEERLDLLRQGQESHHRVEVDYFSASSQKLSTRSLAPYLLVQHLGYWYVIAHDSAHNEVRIFKVERIREARLTEETFEVPADFDMEKFRSDRMLMPGQPLEMARIRFFGEAARTVEDTLVARKVEPQDDGSVIADVEYANGDWLASWVLSHGRDAEVLEPVELRDAVRRRCTEALEYYGGT
jgi:proteasome accessory factor C